MNAVAFMDDPDWARALKVRPSGGPKCGLPAHDDCSPLDPDETARPLEPGGVLGVGMRGYESRPGQVEMLRAVTCAFNAREHLMVEAGTGTGKSLAYLIPAVHWASVNDTPVVVSTATRNLQSQLVLKDIPRAVSTLPPGAADGFRYAVLKGRVNYLCLRETAEMMHEGYWHLSPAERGEIEGFAEWFRRTEDGDLDGLDAPLLRQRLSCGGEDCLGRRCEFFSRCFVQRARERAQRAHLVVANHALVVTEAIAAGSGLLPAYGRVVFDEAHNLENVATDLLSFEFSRPTLLQLLGKVERASRRRRSAGGDTKGFIGAVMRQLRKGALNGLPAAAEVLESVKKARVALNFAKAAADQLFGVLERMFAPVPPATDRLRFRMVGEIRQYALKGLFAAYNSAQWDEEVLSKAALNFEDRLAQVANAVAVIGRALAEATPPGELDLFGDLVAMSESVAGALREYMCEARAAMTASDPKRVCWIERGGKAGTLVRSSPLEIAGDLVRMFWEPKDSVVLCSATLRCGGSFGYVARKLGFGKSEPERARTFLAASPFDYFRQLLALAPTFLPDPSGSTAAYAEAFAPFVSRLASRMRGRTLALFTAYEMMGAVAELAGPALAAAGLRLLVQGGELSREAMVRELKAADADDSLPGVVLFGAQSFWEGVDVPGRALSCVVIARLPFPQAHEPIVEARTEKIIADGGNAFRDYMLPEAVIRFRQGFGRLVRSREDRGLVVVADSRMVVKNYGAAFRKSVEATIHVVGTEEELALRADEFTGCG